MNDPSDAGSSRPARRVPPKSRSQFLPRPVDEVDEFDDVAYDNGVFVYGDGGSSDHVGGHGGGGDGGGGGHGGGH